ncbi:MAG: MBOAT family O-acyltransferase [Spirochaetota bacterium]
MNFTIPLFFFFFFFTFAVRWLLPALQVRLQISQTFLLAMSYIFYMACNPYLGFLIFFTTAMDFYISGLIARHTGMVAKRYLILSLVTNLTILAYFKYMNFFKEAFYSSLNFWGLSSVKFIPWDIVLPLGISFYTFQSMSYTIDVYRRIITPEKSFLSYALYLSFFPQLVAGPIVPAKFLIPELQRSFLKKLDEIHLQEALYYLLSGFIKKTILADRVAPIVNFVFEDPTQLSSSHLWLGVFCFSIQIYCDFSGYTDIARGLALLLGVRLPENFRMPYFASSLSDFWRRWHITLSTWLRDYLYIPLGGSRVNTAITYRNLIVTMLLGGIWHGASWNFLFWGGLHGLWLAVERFVRDRYQARTSDLSKWQVQFPRFLQVAAALHYRVFVFLLVSLLWVFFRSKEFAKTKALFTGLFWPQAGITPFYHSQQVFLAISAFMIVSHCLGYYKEASLKKMQVGLPGFWRLLAYSFCMVVCLLLSVDSQQFIYFVF